MSGMPSVYMRAVSHCGLRPRRSTTSTATGFAPGTSITTGSPADSVASSMAATSGDAA
jgi:hypothetical protein